MVSMVNVNNHYLGRNTLESRELLPDSGETDEVRGTFANS